MKFLIKGLLGMIAVAGMILAGIVFNIDPFETNHATRVTFWVMFFLFFGSVAGLLVLSIQRKKKL
jgi:hypothetical protein